MFARRATHRKLLTRYLSWSRKTGALSREYFSSVCQTEKLWSPSFTRLRVSFDYSQVWEYGYDPAIDLGDKLPRVANGNGASNST